MPIFMPGNDVYEAGAHDTDAIAARKPYLLTYATEDENISRGLRAGWYSAAKYGCGVRGDGLDCGEYPFYSTQEASINSSLRTINPLHNRKEGKLLQQFYDFCKVGVTDRNCLTLPVVQSGDATNRPGVTSMAFSKSGTKTTP